MRTAVAVSVLAALAHVNAQDTTGTGLDFGLILSQHPALISAKPSPTSSTNIAAIVSSIESRMNAAHSNAAPTPVKTTAKPIPKTTAKTTPKKKTTKKIKKTKKTTKKLKKGKRQATGTTSSAAQCVSQSILYSYVPSTNNPAGFLADTNLNALAVAALAPAGFTRSFSAQYGSLYASNYLGYYQLSSYNVTACAAICSGYNGCTAFNTYFERDPVVNPGPSCAGPNAAVSVRCALWGSTISAAQALDIGEWRTNFQVLIQGSNGYVANTPPPALTNFTGPTALPAAISVTTGTEYITSAFSSGTTFNPQFCTTQCQSVTAANRAAAISSAAVTYSACNYANAFLVSYAGTPLGTYCQFYEDSGPAANNANLYSASLNGVNYDITYSYGYQLAANDSGLTAAASCNMVNSTGSYTDVNGVRYVVDCGHDLYTIGDLTRTYNITSFTQCIASCDTVTGCQAIAYSVAGTCYYKTLKGVNVSPTVNTAIDLAWIGAAYTGTSTAAAATSTH